MERGATSVRTGCQGNASIFLVSHPSPSQWRGVGGEVPMDFLLQPSFWPQQIVNGVLIGGVYVLVALGFSIVWGILNIVNLAHGAFIMLGAFVTFFIWDATNL